MAALDARWQAEAQRHTAEWKVRELEALDEVDGSGAVYVRCFLALAI